MLEEIRIQQQQQQQYNQIISNRGKRSNWAFFAFACVMIILEKDSVLLQWHFPMIWFFFPTLTADGSYISNFETSLGIESVRVLRVLLRFCSTLPLSPGLEGFKVEDRADPPPRALKKAWSIATWKANDEKNSSKQTKTQLATYSRVHSYSCHQQVCAAISARSRWHVPPNM